MIELVVALLVINIVILYIIAWQAWESRHNIEIRMMNQLTADLKLINDLIQED